MSNRENELNAALEAMYFGFRRMTLKPDEMLADLGLARVHHRILYFCGRNPRCSVNELLSVMQVSKQYLNQPLRRLIDSGYISAERDKSDKRVKRLELTLAGDALETALTSQQREMFANVFDEVGEGAEQHWHRVMKILVQQI
ncbi:MAG: MarR family transcriptional regulator [Pseudomonadota bacterium]